MYPADTAIGADLNNCKSAVKEGGGYVHLFC